MSIPAAQIEIARQADILSIARRFTRLDRVTATEFAGPCPVCHGDDRFSVNIRKQVFNCRQCGARGDVIALVQFALACSFGQAIAELTGAPATRLASERTRSPPELSTAADQSRKARLLWPSRRPPAGSIAETYLREARGYGGPLPPTLGFLKPSKPEYHPCLIAAFGFNLESVTSVHLTRLKPDGSGKADLAEPKIAIGGHCGLPVVCAPINDGLGLAICEGIEGALNIHEATGLGAWASCGASFLPKLVASVPPDVAVTIFADPDPPGLRYAHELERLLFNRGIDVRVEGHHHER